MTDVPPADEIELSVVVPAHNSSLVLAQSVERLRAYLRDVPSEILVVENGSSDSTAEIARSLQTSESPSVQALTSPKGMGEALRAGVIASTGKRVLLTADDLPFGFDDLDEAAALPTVPPVVIGSKAHPRSSATRGSVRSLSTWGFRTLRRVILGSRIGDSQGTIVVDGAWVRGMVDRLDAPGFLFSTQLCYAAELQGLEVVEVPVRLSEDHGPKASTVRLSDVWLMGTGLLGLRAERRELRAGPRPGSIA